MKFRNVIWGLILVFIGGLFILKNLDIVYFSWHSIFRLWPLVFIFIGIAILPLKDWIKFILTLVTLIIALIIIMANPTYRSPWSERFNFWFDKDRTESTWNKEIDQRISEVYDATITDVIFNFDAAAGNFNINSTTGEMFEFIKEGNIGKYMYSIKDLGSTREVVISLEEGNVRHIDLKNNVEIKLNPNPIWDLKIDVGAAEIDMDLSPFKVKRLDIDGGASSIRVRLGGLQDQSEVIIDSGASSITIEVPENIACEVDANTVLSSKDLNGFDRVSDDTFVTPGFSDSTKNIIIKVEAAVSSLTVNRY